MKKAMTIAMASAMMLTMALSTSAARSDVFHAAYGTAVVDGKKDAIYDDADRITIDVNDGLDSGYATGEYWVVWNENTLYCYANINDSTPATKNPDGSINSDSVDIIVYLVDNFVKGNDYPENAADKAGGQLRVDPRMNTKTLTDHINDSGVSKFLKDTNGSKVAVASVSDTGYSFEFSMNYEVFKPKADDVIGFAMQINDDINNDGKRDCKIYSSNGVAKMSAQYGSCGDLILNAKKVVEKKESTAKAEAPKTADVASLTVMLAAASFITYAVSKKK